VVQRLRAVPGGASIPVVIADLEDVPVTGPYRLVYLGVEHLVQRHQPSPAG
jgi:hypothetical protein